MNEKTLGTPQPDDDVVNREPRVLLIGYGWVGQYCGKYFTQAHYVGSSGIIQKQVEHTERCDDYECVCPDQQDNTVYDAQKYDLAIISVPTPMNPKNGQCDTSIVEEVVAKFKDQVEHFLIKSTVEIGTTDRLSKKYGVNIAMSPEYIGETLGHPLLEARRDAFQIIGGEKKTTAKIAEYWRTVLHASAPIFLCTALEAEIIKYCENMWIMQRVDYWNDVFEIAETFGAEFTNIREGLVLDPRFSRTHSNVYPNNRGWSGKCLPKDMNALAFRMRVSGRPLETLEHQIEKNVQLRSGYKNKERLIPEKPVWKDTNSV